jgi:hypothetical protein
LIGTLLLEVSINTIFRQASKGVVGQTVKAPAWHSYYMQGIQLFITKEQSTGSLQMLCYNASPRPADSLIRKEDKSLTWHILLYASALFFYHTQTSITILSFAYNNSSS